MFGFSLYDEKIVTENSEDVEKLVKFLCKKAMLDLCGELPVEVSATKPWR